MEPGIGEPEQLTMRTEQRMRYGDVQQLAGRLQEPVER
jgi:hypothetical protein